MLSMMVACIIGGLNQSIKLIVSSWSLIEGKLKIITSASRGSKEGLNKRGN